MMAMQGLIPDEDAMMNLAIALSLQNEVGSPLPHVETAGSMPGSRNGGFY